MLFEDKRLWESLLHTMIFLIIALPIELILGMLLALLCLEKLPGKQIFIALLILPTVISPIVAGAAWRLLFDNRFGPINQMLGWIMGEPVTILWTVNPTFVYPAILITEIWQWTPFMFLLLLAALGNVDRSQIEAAEIDGASYWRIFFKIMLPAIKPIPGTRTETLSIYAYVQGFKQFETSYTAAIAFLVIIILTVVVVTMLNRMEIAR